MKVLLINPLIPDYRIPIFNLIGNEIDLTILHNGTIRNEEFYNFKQLSLSLIKIGPFFWSKFNLNTICNNYDIIISEANIRHLDRNLLILNPFRKYKWITWGIGVSASYDKRIGEKKYFDFFRYFIFKSANAHIFYSSYPINLYLKKGFKYESLFIANNTTKVLPIVNDTKKDILLFVGTLYKQKKIYNLLNSYRSYLKLSTIPIPLHIIGDGIEYSNIKSYLKNNNLENYVFIHGAIYDQNILRNYFTKSIACISPGQAGLSVLTSMGYGTAFITRNDAITGGEIFNILHNENGIIYDNDNELEKILLDIEHNNKKYIDLGKNARYFYEKNRTPEMMAKTFIDACEYVLN